MENNTTQIPTAYDYRRYDRIWQRVSPDLDPYPDIRAAGDSTETCAPTSAPVSAVPAAAAPAAAVLGAAVAPAMENGAAGGGNSGEDTLPGAEMNPSAWERKPSNPLKCWRAL